MKIPVLLENYFLLGDLERQIGVFLEFYKQSTLPREPWKPDASRCLIRLR